MSHPEVRFAEGICGIEKDAAGNPVYEIKWGGKPG
jgi:hypothetical protein